MKICKKETKKEVVKTEYEVCGDYCCKKMKKWLSIDVWSHRTLKYIPNNKQFRIQTNISNDYGEDDDEYETLNFCPFCGEELDNTEYYEQKDKPKKKKRLFRNETKRA